MCPSKAPSTPDPRPVRTWKRTRTRLGRPETPPLRRRQCLPRTTPEAGPRRSTRRLQAKHAAQPSKPRIIPRTRRLQAKHAAQPSKPRIIPSRTRMAVQTSSARPLGTGSCARLLLLCARVWPCKNDPGTPVQVTGSLMLTQHTKKSASSCGARVSGTISLLWNNR